MFIAQSKHPKPFSEPASLSSDCTRFSRAPRGLERLLDLRRRLVLVELAVVEHLGRGQRFGFPSAGARGYLRLMQILEKCILQNSPPPNFC